MPSARYEGRNLVVYMQNLDKDCFMEEVESREFVWSDLPYVVESRGQGLDRRAPWTRVPMKSPAGGVAVSRGL